jgi:outer membrane protein TolC
VNLPVPQRDLVSAQPGGIDSATVGRRAAITSYNAKQSLETLRSAAAQVDAAWSSFLPRLSGTARYTRLSSFTPPNLFPGGSLVATPQTTPGPLAAGAQLEASGPFTFPIILNNWLLQASLAVPISDYFFTIQQQYGAALNARDAAAFDEAAARAKSAADGRVLYYSWLQAIGAEVVAEQALQDERNHLADAQNQFQAGNASKADVLRAETSVASAELQVVHAKNFAELAEEQVRVAIHAKPDEKLVPGEDLVTPVNPFPGAVPQLTTEALSGRPEIKSLQANAVALHKRADAQKNGVIPSLSAFADGIEGNPNSRQIPQSQSWLGTWDVGAQLTWDSGQALTKNATGRDLQAQADALTAAAGNYRDSVIVEVLQDYQAVHEADFSLESTKRELASATEAYRVQRQLFENGRGTSTTLTDAETELTRARLDELNARTNVRISRVRLEHALGRDVHLSKDP